MPIGDREENLRDSSCESFFFFVGSEAKRERRENENSRPDCLHHRVESSVSPSLTMMMMMEWCAASLLRLCEFEQQARSKNVETHLNVLHFSLPHIERSRVRFSMFFSPPPIEHIHERNPIRLFLTAQTVARA